MSNFIEDIEQQYEAYCKIAEDYGFVDLNAKKSGFRCTTKSSEFNAGWVAFTGAMALVFKHRQTEIDHLNSVLDERTKEWLQAIELGDYFKNVAKPLRAEIDQLQSQINDMAEVGLNQEKALMVKDKRIAELEAERKSLKQLFDSLISECELWGYESDQADKVVVLLKQAFVGGVQMEKLDSYSPMANRHDT